MRRDAREFVLFCGLHRINLSRTHFSVYITRRAATKMCQTLINTCPVPTDGCTELLYKKYFLKERRFHLHISAASDVLDIFEIVNEITSFRTKSRVLNKPTFYTNFKFLRPPKTSKTQNKISLILHYVIIIPHEKGRYTRTECVRVSELYLLATRGWSGRMIRMRARSPQPKYTPINIVHTFIHYV